MGTKAKRKSFSPNKWVLFAINHFKRMKTYQMLVVNGKICKTKADTKTIVLIVQCDEEIRNEKNSFIMISFRELLPVRIYGGKSFSLFCEFIIFHWHHPALSLIEQSSEFHNHHCLWVGFILLKWLIYGEKINASELLAGK